MVKYICKICERTFSQKGHLEDHQKRKTPCKKENTIEGLVEQKVNEAFSKANEGIVKIDSTPHQLQSSTMDYSKKTREELIAICKEKSIKGYSGKKKDDIVKLLTPSVNSVNPTLNINSNSIIVPVDTKIRVASLFAGCGGLDYGFHKNSKYTHVFVNDFDEEACKTYEKNFETKTTCGDIKQIKTIPDCDIIIGGFPCQGFSMANPYRDEKDKRNELYLEILRLLKLKQPKYFLLENVKGLLNMGGYATNEDKKNKTSGFRCFGRSKFSEKDVLFFLLILLVSFTQ